MVRFARLVCLALTALASCSLVAHAQTTTTDAATPSGQAKGAHPLSSFGGSAFDRVNLFNGNVSMSFPLAGVGGRAGMGAGVTLSYNEKFWRMRVDRPEPQSTLVFPTWTEWDGGSQLAPGWRVHSGRAYIRYGGYAPVTGEGGCTAYAFSLTRVSFVAPDGTEYELRDTQYHGQPVDDDDPACGTTTVNRGKIFRTADGTAATFISDTNIFDNNLVVDVGPGLIGYANGDVYLRDGTHFRVDDGKVMWQQGRNGNRVQYTYYAPNSDTPGLLSTVTDTLGRVILIEYNVPEGADTLLVRVTEQRGTAPDRITKVVRKRLTNVLRLDAQTPPPTFTNPPTYEELWPNTTTTGPFNPWVPEKLVLPSGHAWQFQYNRYGEVARVVMPAGGAVEYDVAVGVGQIGSGIQALVFRYLQTRRTYPSAASTTAEGRTEYDDPSFGYTVATSYLYDARGNLTSVTQGTQPARTFVYDALGRLTTATQPESGVTSYTYDKNANLKMKQDGRGAGFQVTYGYDELNRVTTVDYANTPEPNPDVVHHYDRSAHPAGVPAPSFSGARSTPLGRLYAVITAAEPGGSARTATATNQEQTGIFYNYDVGGRAVTVSQLLDAAHYETTTTYNEASAPLTETYARPGATSSAIQNTYNGAGMLTEVKRTAPTPALVVAAGITYAPSGAVELDTLGNGLAERTEYNSRLQPVMITLGTNLVPAEKLSLAYDYGVWPGMGPLAAGLPDQTKNTGNVGRVKITPGTGPTTFDQYYQYDPLNRLSLAAEYGPPAGGSGSDTIGTYVASTRFFNLKNTNAAGPADASFSFGLGGSVLPITGDWDGDGIDTIGVYLPATTTFFLRNVNAGGAADVTFNFGGAGSTPLAGDWDGLPAGGGGGTLAWAQEFTYDRWGNRSWGAQTTPSVRGPELTYNAATNRLTGIGPYSTPLYDGAGNLEKDAATRTYSYDANGMLHTAEVGGATSKYVYDGAGRRVKTIVGTTTTRFIYNAAGALVAEYVGTGTTPTKEYVYGPRGLLATVEGSTVKYVTADHLGSPRVVTGAGGTVLDRRDFHPFGEEIPAGIFGRTTALNYGGASGLRQKFTAYERDTETGLDFAQARYYASGQGRFTSPDEPLVDQYPDNPQSWNLYTYGRNSPLVLIDPAGRQVIWYYQDKRIGTEYNVTIDHDKLTLTTADGATYNLDVVQGVQEIQDGPLSVAPTLFEQMVGDYVRENQRNDGYVPDPQQSGFSQLFSGTRWIDPRALTFQDLMSRGEMPFGPGGVAFSKQAIGHGARHLAGSSLSPAVVEEAIRQDVLRIVNSSSATGSWWGRVEVAGRTIEYRAYTLSNGTVNVGTYYLP
jgi:RHS repeat-associated protein